MLIGELNKGNLLSAAVAHLITVAAFHRSRVTWLRTLFSYMTVFTLHTISVTQYCVQKSTYTVAAATSTLRITGAILAEMTSYFRVRKIL